MMTHHLEEILRRIKQALSDAYGARLRGVVLFGSMARGDNQTESDIDLFVLFNDAVILGKDLKGLIRVLYPFQMELMRPIHAIPVNEEIFYAAQYAVFRKAQAEGITL